MQQNFYTPKLHN